MASGQRLRDALVFHDDEGKAICERPLLVSASAVELKTTPEGFGFRFNYLDIRIALNVHDELCAMVSFTRTIHAVRHLQQHPCTGDNAVDFFRFDEFHCPRMHGISRAENSDEKVRVGEDTP